jgi:hypothetical protein
MLTYASIGGAGPYADVSLTYADVCRFDVC